MAAERDVAERFDTGGWAFTPEVVEVFDDHVRASVPHYDVIQHLVAAASDWLLPARGVYADVGASTGTTAELILSRHPDRGVTAWLYDEQRDMLLQAREKLRLGGDQLHTVVRRVQDGMEHEGADLTTVLFTLQFMPLADRLLVLRDARERTGRGGALLVAEKVLPVDSRWAEVANEMSHDWKAEHGIGDSAIRAKARALRGVLRPTSVGTLLWLVEEAGWQSPEVIFRWHSWVLLGAFANDP